VAIQCIHGAPAGVAPQRMHLGAVQRLPAAAPALRAAMLVRMGLHAAAAVHGQHMGHGTGGACHAAQATLQGMQTQSLRCGREGVHVMRVCLDTCLQDAGVGVRAGVACVGKRCAGAWNSLGWARQRAEVEAMHKLFLANGRFGCTSSRQAPGPEKPQHCVGDEMEPAQAITTHPSTQIRPPPSPPGCLIKASENPVVQPEEVAGPGQCLI